MAQIQTKNLAIIFLILDVIVILVLVGVFGARIERSQWSLRRCVRGERSFPLIGDPEYGRNIPMESNPDTKKAVDPNMTGNPSDPVSFQVSRLTPPDQ